MLNNSLAVSTSLSDEIFRDRVNVVCFDLAEECGIAGGTLSRPPVQGSGVISKASLEASGSPVGNDSGSTMLAALANLPANRGVWLFAVSPWIWSVIVWHSPPPRRQRVRRKRD